MKTDHPWKEAIELHRQGILTVRELASDVLGCCVLGSSSDAEVIASVRLLPAEVQELLLNILRGLEERQEGWTPFLIGSGLPPDADACRAGVRRLHRLLGGSETQDATTQRE